MDPVHTLFSPLPRQGPGLPEETAAALQLVKNWLPERPDVIDLGCGSGASTAVLAQELHGRILAVDLDEGLLSRTRRATRKLPSLVATRVADMAAPTMAEGRFHLCWSEGAIYNLGFAKGLDRWRFLLRPGGCMVVSHLTWLRPDPPAEAVAAWAGEVPDMTDAAGNVAIMQRLGFVVLGTRVLPSQAWWKDFYTPLLARIETLSERWSGDAERLAVLEAARREVALYENHGDSYGYVFYAGRRAD